MHMNHARRSVIVFSLVSVLALVMVGAAVAAPGGGGGSRYTGTFSLVNLTITDAPPHYGQDVTFDVHSNAPKPYVKLVCSQGGIKVWQQTAGFYDGYPWTQTFTLSGGLWAPGAANCDADLYVTNAKRGTRTTLDTMSFHVEA